MEVIMVKSKHITRRKAIRTPTAQLQRDSRGRIFRGPLSPAQRRRQVLAEAWAEARLEARAQARIKAERELTSAAILAKYETKH